MVVAEVPGGVERLTRDMPLLAEFPTCQVLDECCSSCTCLRQACLCIPVLWFFQQAT